MPSLDDQVAARAYQIWEEEGRPHGRHLEHWRQAAAELGAPSEAKPKPKAAAKPKAEPKTPPKAKAAPRGKKAAAGE